MEKERGESISAGGLGSCRLVFASMAVRPLYRCGWRGIFWPIILKSADGALSFMGENIGRVEAMSLTRSSNDCHLSTIDILADIIISLIHFQLS
jgi:hypothetical protein